MKSRTIRIVTLLYIALITALSVVKLPDVEPMAIDSGGGFTYVDKVIHIGFYFVFNLLTLLSFAARRLSTVILISVGVVAYGGVIELIQLHIGRECSVYDIIANSIGVILAVVVFRTLGVSRLIKL